MGVGVGQADDGDGDGEQRHPSLSLLRDMNHPG